MGVLIASHCIDFCPFLQFSEIMQYFKPVFHCITRFSWGVIDINLKNEKLGRISGENFLMVRSARMHCCLSMGLVAVPLACTLKPYWRNIRLQIGQNNPEVGGECQTAKHCSLPPTVISSWICPTPSSNHHYQFTEDMLNQQYQLITGMGCNVMLSPTLLQLHLWWWECCGSCETLSQRKIHPSWGPLDSFPTLFYLLPPGKLWGMH